MKILYAHPTRGRGDRACIGFVDVELDKNIRLYGIRVLRHPDGQHAVYAPQSGQRRTATFSRPLAEQLTALAVAALGTAYDQ